MDSAELAQIHLAIDGDDGHITADHGRTQMSIGIVATKIVLAMLLSKCQCLGAGMEILSLIAAGRDPIFKYIYQILLQHANADCLLQMITGSLQLFQQLFFMSKYIVEDWRVFSVIKRPVIL